MILFLTRRLRALDTKSERGSILVITAVVMVAAVVAASYAIDTAVWFVHQRHLQTQADAAALAAANDFQFNCGPAGDTTITNDIHEYDGTGLGTSTTYNAQVPSPSKIAPLSLEPTPSKTLIAGHAEYSQVNQSDFMNQTIPADSGLSGSPCTDGVIDVKMTEQNVPSFLIPGIGPTYVNAQAEVGFKQEQTSGGGLPFVEPLPTPTSAAVEFVNENTGAVLSTPGVVSLSTPSSGPTKDVVWSASGVNINYSDPTSGVSNPTTDQFPVGMRVAFNPTGGTATFPCTSPEVCYDASSSSSKTGVVYTRVWYNSGSPGLNSGSTTSATDPVAPQASDVWLQPCTTSGSSCTSCPIGPNPSYSNFFSSSSATSEQLCANMTFTTPGNPNATSLTCAQTSLNVSAGGTAVTMNCPSGGPNGTWSSGPLSVPAFSPSANGNAGANNGAMNITMGWNVMNGCLPAGASGGTTKTTSSCSQSSGTVQKLCGDGQGNDPNPCQGSFDGNTYASPETVQQAYSGAYSLAAALPSSEGGISTPGSYSGTISSASVVNSSGAEIQSIQNGTNTTNNTITVDFYGYEPDSTVTNPTNPFELTLGGNQGNGDLGCAGNNGKTSFDAAIESGCAGTYETNTLEPPATVCPNGSTSATPGPATCLKTNPGGGKSTSIAQALNTKINGSASASCTSPNYWAPGQNGAPGNSVGQILSQTINGAPDPRLVELFITDNMTLPGGAATVPIRGMAEFYITGWGATMNKGSDPCVSGSPSSNPGNLSLPYTSDDTPPDNTDGVIMGHFVTYVNVNSTPSNSNCIEGTLAICSPVLLK